MKYMKHERHVDHAEHAIPLLNNNQKVSKKLPVLQAPLSCERFLQFNLH